MRHPSLAASVRATEAMANIREAIELYLEPTEDDTQPQAEAEVVELAL